MFKVFLTKAAAKKLVRTQLEVVIFTLYNAVSQFHHVTFTVKFCEFKK